MSTLLRGNRMGQAVMLGSLFGVIVIVFGLVLRFDPEARRARPNENAE